MVVMCGDCDALVVVLPYDYSYENSLVDSASTAQCVPPSQFQRLPWPALACTGLYWPALACTGLYWPILACIVTM